MNTLSFALVLALAAGAAHAQFKCVAPGGAVTLQQTQCPAGAVEKRLRLSPVEGGPGPDRPEHIRKAFAERRLAVGMTLGEVDTLMVGAADRENTTTTALGTRRQRVYVQPGVTFYVYVSEADVVTAVQESRR